MLDRFTKPLAQRPRFREGATQEHARALYSIFPSLLTKHIPTDNRNASYTKKGSGRKHCETPKSKPVVYDL